MSSATYLRYELLRTFRNRRFLVLSLGFPVVLYFLVAGPNRHVHDLGGSGISAPLYFMVGLASFGTMNAMVSSGARIAAERTVGWNRQLRLTPLSPRQYFRAKVLASYGLSLCTLALLYIAGGSLGVHLAAGNWLHMTVQILIGLIPFAALGIWLGHVLSSDSVGPAVGGLTALFSFLGGVWYPITSGAMHDIAEALPSFWLVQAAHVALGGSGWGARGWLVDGAWTVALGVLAARAFRRDTGRA
ncbi:MAG TPA: ABC transporter permease [Gaiellaceae bacterium]|nr:ABC transporter permease [Gaiellaceae bacterium]